MDSQLLKDYAERSAVYKQFDKYTSDEIKQKISEYRDNMRNFSIVVGAIAAASLTSLGLPIQKIDYLIIFGSCELIVMAFLCFVHLFVDNSKEITSLLEGRKKLKPLEDVLTAFEELTFGKISREQYDHADLEFQLHRKDFLKTNKRDASKSFDSNDNEVWLLGGVALGLAIVISGFILPMF